ncbi:two-component sensor histidine kinase [Tamilnaduibacter salinus]|uniref:histidine kinase n=1 Tax=Tamilnaduibacter salinus TaxID=1484056 RepID=A0A2A2I3F2_9GAMM|nr:sensor histidine kinase [Tamilnaduibacter salinus]PAV26167.1 two-component sensor histidine kinase [Tamilnaduibacter salinus]
MSSLRNRVIAIVILASLMTVIAISLTAYQSLGKDQRRLILKQERFKAERLANQVNQSIQKRMLALSVTRPAFKSQGRLRSPDELESAIRRNADLVQRFFPAGVLIFDASDTAIAESTYVPDRLGTNYADRPHFQRLQRSREPVISKPIMGRTTGVPLLSFLMPILHEGEMLGSVGGIIKLSKESILPPRAGQTTPDNGTISMIVDARNRLYIESPDPEPEEALRPLPAPGEDALIDAVLATPSGSSVMHYQGQKYLVATDTLEPLHWVFVRAIPYETAMAPIRESFRQFFLISAAVTILLLMLAWFVARSLTRPLTTATQSINDMAENKERSEVLREDGPREIRELSKAFNRLSRERQQSDRLKDDFIASVSHELRTPLTSIAGSLKMLVGGVGGTLPEKAHSMADIALRNSEQLNNLIADLLDFNKLTAGKRELSISRCSVDASVRDAVEGNQAMANMYQVNLTAGEESGLFVEADQQALRQILDNLISNAIKHSPKSGIVRIATRKEATNTISITVSDQGDGVPESFEDQIFQRFSQAERGTTRASTGTGLGLAISRELVRAMDGDIGYVNDRGAHFWITLRSGQ